jgi:hypothetical protein
MDREHAEVIVTSQQLVKETRQAVSELLRVLKRQLQTPAQLREVSLSQTTPKARDEAGDTALSIGIYNPSPVTIYSTINGGAAEAGRDSLSFPPNSLVVLPLAVQDLELGADPTALAAGSITVYVLRYDSVQPAFLGAI